MTFILPESERGETFAAPFASLWTFAFDRPQTSPAAKAFDELRQIQLGLFHHALKLWLLPFDLVDDAPAEEPAGESPAPLPEMRTAEAVVMPFAPAAAATPSAPPGPAEALTSTAAAALLAMPTGEPDDLERIVGIGPKLKRTLNELGVRPFRQIAAWTPAEVASINDRIGFKGRIEREGWQVQASRLAKGAPKAA